MSVPASIVESINYDVQLNYFYESITEDSEMTEDEKLMKWVSFIKNWVGFSLKGVEHNTKGKYVKLKAKDKAEAEAFKERFYVNKNAKEKFDIASISSSGEILIKFIK